MLELEKQNIHRNRLKSQTTTQVTLEAKAESLFDTEAAVRAECTGDPASGRCFL